MEKLKKIEEESASDENLKNFEKNEVPKLKHRNAKVESRIEKTNASAKAATEKAVRKAYAEIEQLRAEVVTVIRATMSKDAKTGDQFFEGVNGGETITSEKFVACLEGLVSETFKLADGQGQKVFQHIVAEGDGITKAQFLEVIRMFYKCVKGTVLTETISIKSKTVRRLETGEVLEALEGPSIEEGANVQRVRCQAVNDDAGGWVTIQGNQGTPFLEPGGNLYTAVKETVLTDGLSVQDSKTIRRISKGEIVEVVEFAKKDDSVGVKRIKAKAKIDGATGWITLSGNQGTSFLEPC